MAGRERSGASAADSDLFAGRPWVLVADGAEPAAEAAVRDLAVDVGVVALYFLVLRDMYSLNEISFNYGQDQAENQTFFFHC